MHALTVCFVAATEDDLSVLKLALNNVLHVLHHQMHVLRALHVPNIVHIRYVTCHM